MSVYNELQVRAFIDQIFWRLGLMEARLALVSDQLGMPDDDLISLTPGQVVELLASRGNGAEGSFRGT